MVLNVGLGYIQDSLHFTQVCAKALANAKAISRVHFPKRIEVAQLLHISPATAHDTGHAAFFLDEAGMILQ